jgi:hypothetical protein
MLKISIVAIAGFVLALAPAANADLVTHYKLDETSGTTAVDSVGSNDGTVASPTWQVDTTGLTDPTSTTGVSMPSPNLLSGVTGLASADDTFTIMFWLQSDDFVDETFARFLSIGNDATGSEAIFAFVLETEVDEDQVEVIYYPDGNTTGEGESNPLTVSPNPLSTGWHHHAAVVDGTSLSYYLDGALKGSGTMVGALTNTEFYILGSPTQTGNGTAGSIDEVGVFDTALSQSEISGYMTNGLEGTPSAADPEITSIEKSGNTVTVNFTGAENGTFDLNKAAGLDGTFPDNEDSTPDSVTIVGTSGTLTDSTATEDAAFYQVKQQP